MSLNIVQKKIVQDIVQKFPKGPTGSLKKVHYFESYRYSDTYDREIVHIALQSPKDSNGRKVFWGYQPEDLWKICRGDVSTLGCKDIVRESFPDVHLTSRAINRRARRLAHRLLSAVNHVKKFGTQGTWKIQWGYSHEGSFYVQANSEESALAASSIISGMFGQNVNSVPSIKFVDIENIEGTRLRNEELARDILRWPNRKVLRIEEELAEAKKALRSAEDASARLRVATSLCEETYVERD